MMGAAVGRQDRLFYEFDLEEMVPTDHLLRKTDAVLDLGWLRRELAPFYSHMGCPSVDPELMIRMLLVGYADPCNPRPPRVSAITQKKDCRLVWLGRGVNAR
jgi:transposase